MTVAVSTRLRAAHRSGLVRLTLVFLFFLGVSALAGGIALVFGGASGMQPPPEWLDAIPLVRSWFIPGLVLGLGFGVGSLVAGFGVFSRPRWPRLAGLEALTGHHWSWLATILLGVGHVIWIGLELVYLPEYSVLQAVYGPVGLALAVLPFTAPVSRYLEVSR